MMRALIAVLLLGAALVSLSGSSNAAYRLMSGVGAGPKSSGGSGYCIEGSSSSYCIEASSTSYLLRAN